MKNIEFGQRMRIFRESLGPEWTQTVFANKIGGDTKQANVSSWEKGTIPDGEALYLILTAFPQLDGGWLFGKSDTMLKSPPHTEPEVDKLRKLADKWKQKYIDAIEGKE